MRNIWRAIAFSSLLISPFLSATSTFSTQQQQFIEQTSKQYGLTNEFVTEALTTAKRNDEILQRIARPWEAKPWHQYQPIFVKDSRIEQGAEFWQQHQALLARAEAQYGVPAAIIVAILGVESNFGQNKGQFKVLDTLYTLGFHYPKRSRFFSSELAEFLALCQEQQLDWQSITGSYAGAMGWGQFIASSYRHYAVDFDGDGQADILNSAADAIGSVANYFAKHRWQTGQPIAEPVTLTNAVASTLLTKSLKPSLTKQQLAHNNIAISGTEQDKQRYSIVELDNADGKEHWLGYYNFYVITRYNHSPLYAMAVFQLSEKIKQKFESVS